jgi:hypothetical protein
MRRLLWMRSEGDHPIVQRNYDATPDALRSPNPRIPRELSPFLGATAVPVATAQLPRASSPTRAMPEIGAVRERRLAVGHRW